MTSWFDSNYVVQFQVFELTFQAIYNEKITKLEKKMNGKKQELAIVILYSMPSTKMKTSFIVDSVLVTWLLHQTKSLWYHMWPFNNSLKLAQKCIFYIFTQTEFKWFFLLIVDFVSIILNFTYMYTSIQSLFRLRQLCNGVCGLINLEIDRKGGWKWNLKNSDRLVQSLCPFS